MAAWVTDPWDGSSHAYADQVHEDERTAESRLLGPDGRPLRYEARPPIGFDLRPRGGERGGAS